MEVRGILRSKGTEVATIDPDAMITDAIAALAEHGVGALVVSTDGTHVEGILSERDVVRALARDDTGALGSRVADVCTTTVKTAGLDDSVDELMSVMTSGRFRHLPVVVDGELAGIVSIGDVVKYRVAELEGLTRDLESYVTGTW